MPGRTMRQAGSVPSQNDGALGRCTLCSFPLSDKEEARETQENPSVLERGISFRYLGLIAPQIFGPFLG